jgi:hypothetical protein
MLEEIFDYRAKRVLEPFGDRSLSQRIREHVIKMSISEPPDFASQAVRSKTVRRGFRRGRRYSPGLSAALE